ncbi:PREDICTED: uncharacterized protein LOC18599679 [Theobroma cacao]|uniref:Uncharacterized protein LOC18599679 n=1 Tax=Theobroma cacao TaxID=3641 RepID=A0AB32WGP8_THECC|nr:PREDICTED: uncharacterized protein LOC18599679 [Theobroma cacao]
MEGRKQGDVRIYIVSTLFFACIVAGGVFLCLYMLRPDEESAPWYPVAGIILVGIPWIFWIGAYAYRCCAYSCCQNGGGNVNRAHISSAKTQTYASPGPAARSMRSSEYENSPLKSPNGDHRHVHFGEVVVMGGAKNDQNDNGDENPHEGAKGYSETEQEGKEHSQDNTASDKDYVSAASRKGEAPLIVTVSS